MRNKYLGILLIASVLSISACGKKGGKTGTKTTKDAFLQATANLPVTHPFVYAEISYDDNGEKGVDKCDYVNGEWVVQDKEQSHSYLLDNTIQKTIPSFIHYEEDGATVNYYLNPFSIDFSYTVEEETRISVKETFVWNDYGLPTHLDYTAGDGTLTETFEANITYRTSGGGTSETSGGGEYPVGSMVSEAQWKDEFLMNNQQNYAFSVVGSQQNEDGSTTTNTLEGKYDGGKIQYANGDSLYFINILWDTLNPETRKADIEDYYSYDGTTWKMALDKEIDIDGLSEITMKIPFSYSDFTFSNVEYEYVASQSTFFNVTFTDLHVKFVNYHVSEIELTYSSEYRTVTYKATYEGYGQQTVTFPEVTPTPTPESQRETFEKWAMSLDVTAHPYKTATQTVTMNNSDGESSVTHNFVWDAEKAAWAEDGEADPNAIPTARYVIEMVALFEQQYAMEFQFKASGDLRDIHYGGSTTTEEGRTVNIIFDGVVNDYGYCSQLRIYMEIESSSYTRLVDENVETIFYE